MKHTPKVSNGCLCGVSYYFALEVTGHTLLSIRYFYETLDSRSVWSSWTGWFRNGWAFFHDLIVWRLQTNIAILHDEAGCMYRWQLKWRSFPITQRMIGDGVGPDTHMAVITNVHQFGDGCIRVCWSVPIADLDI